jgi:hypothetical protein
LKIQCSKDELRKRRLFLALPCYGGACAGIYARSLMDLSALCVQWGVSLQVYMLYNESLVTRARAYAADEFMRSQASHFMFIDSDIGFQAQDVLSLLALSDPKSDKDVLCGPYPKKCISWEKIIQAVNKGVGEKDPTQLDRFVGDFVFNPKYNGPMPLSEPMEVLESGTGFMMIQRHVFDRFKAAYPEYSYKPDHIRTAAFDGTREIMLYFQAEIDREFADRYFNKAIEEMEKNPEKALEIAKQHHNQWNETNAKMSKRYLSEDYWFCQKIQKIGMKVWLCPWMRLQHFGSFTFGGSLRDLAMIGANPTADVTKLRGLPGKQKPLIQPAVSTVKPNLGSLPGLGPLPGLPGGK